MNVSNSGHVEGSERRQRILLPDMLDEYVDEDNPVRFIDAFVDRAQPEEDSDSSIPSQARLEDRRTSPADLLRLYVYGYLNQIRSSRKLERECRRNLELVWLMKKLTSGLQDHIRFSEEDSVTRSSQSSRNSSFFARALNLFGLRRVGIRRE